MPGREVDDMDAGSAGAIEMSTPTPAMPTTRLAGDPVAGEAIRRKFLEKQQSVELRERRARSRAISQIQTRGRIAAQPKAPRATRTRPANNDTGGGGVNQEPPPPSNSGGDDNKSGKPRGPVLRNTQAFYKEFASIKAKRREKQPAQDQASASSANQEPTDLSASTALPQQQTPIPLSLETPHWTLQYPLPPKPATSYFNPFAESVYSYQGSLKPYIGQPDTPVEDVDPAVLELERIASR